MIRLALAVAGIVCFCNNCPVAGIILIVVAFFLRR